MHFSQQPVDKLNRIADLQSQGCRVVMIGDGLNDSGALAKADVGIAVSDEVNVFTPASDIIIDAAKLIHLDSILKAAKQSVQIIRYAFALSLLYNLIGTYFAVTGKLEPIIAAILMPLSSISIVVFTTIATNLIFSKQKF
jgi:Cu+-exporting ATPase